MGTYWKMFELPLYAQSTAPDSRRGVQSHISQVATCFLTAFAFFCMLRLEPSLRPHLSQVLPHGFLQALIDGVILLLISVSVQVARNLLNTLAILLHLESTSQRAAKPFMWSFTFGELNVYIAIAYFFLTLIAEQCKLQKCALPRPLQFVQMVVAVSNTVFLVLFIAPVIISLPLPSKGLLVFRHLAAFSGADTGEADLSELFASVERSVFGM